VWLDTGPNRGVGKSTMSWSRRYAIRSYLLSTVWIAPVVALVLEQLIFRIAYAYQLDLGWFPGFHPGGKEGTIAIADYVISSSIAFIVFTFSSLIVAIQVASGQLTPRIIATALLRDNAIRGSVAVFVFALMIAIAVKTRVDTIPRSLVSITGLLGMLSALVFMFLIDHAARLLRPVNIVWRIAQQGLQVIDDIHPHLLAATTTNVQTLQQLGLPERTIPHQHSSAIVIAVNIDALVAEAKRAGAIIELVPRVGDFVAKNDVLFRLHGSGSAKVDQRLLQNQVAFGRERTIEQDSTFAFRVVVDIAIKALSPAINDPTTAVIAIDQLQRLLRTVAARDLRDERIFDGEGQLRLIFHTPNWQDFLDLTFSEIRMYGAGNLQVARRLRAMVETISHGLPERRLSQLQRELDLLDRTVERLYTFPEDIERSRVSDPQGLGGASHQ
ncbi:MAG: DUF2254 domain-containing protein, partial [Candidatus Binatus sp.]